ncbi:MAG TPA: DUF1501 domain-containing protein [Pirellulaceae bacterium]|nr:DUF1501 domain-containing protein [Pirellulaceae bacterium]
MNPWQEHVANVTRRHFFRQGGNAVGWAALASLMGPDGGMLGGGTPGGRLLAAENAGAQAAPAMKTHFPPKAKHVIYLHMVGGPPQMDLFDHKPVMEQWYDKDLPESVRMGQRLTTMTSGQARFPIAPSKFKFAKHGQCGMELCELLPYKAKMVDDMCFLRSMHTEAINHEPAITYIQTGNQLTGRPCLGAWASYGLGSLNQNLPTFVVLVARPTNTEQVQAISARLWSSGYLQGEHAGVAFRSAGDPILYINNPPGVPSEIRRKTLDGLKKLNELNYQQSLDPETQTRIQQYELAFRMQGEHAGVAFRSAGDPILYINNPPGVPSEIRRKTLDGLKKLNELNYQQSLDPETQTRIQQYELAFRMQGSVPDLVNIASEPEHTFKLYGDEAKKPGTFANTVLQARRMVERGVRFIQVYHNNWDTHANVAGRLPDQCRDVDQPCYGLVQDLKQRGLLDQTLIIWGGEFGRTIYSQGGVSKQNYGRDHHPRCFTMWLAGGGIKGGTIYGETDDFSYNIVDKPVHIRDFHATILQLLGFDHERFSVKFQGLDARLTGVEPCRVIKEILA